MITATIIYEQTDELVKALAIAKDWKETVSIPSMKEVETPDGILISVPSTDEVPNPETFDVFIKSDLEKMVNSYFEPLIEMGVQAEVAKLGLDEQKKVAEEQIREQIVTAMLDAVTISVVVSE